MNRTYMEECIKSMVDDDRFDAIVPIYLDIAEAKVLKHLFPFDDNPQWDDVPEVYHMQTCEIAVFLINKRGAEGETNHKENGTERTYQGAAVPASMFAGMTPKVGMLR